MKLDGLKEKPQYSLLYTIYIFDIFWTLPPSFIYNFVLKVATIGNWTIWVPKNTWGV